MLTFSTQMEFGVSKDKYNLQIDYLIPEYQKLEKILLKIIHTYTYKDVFIIWKA